MRSRTKLTSREVEYDELHKPEVFPGGGGGNAGTRTNQQIVDEFWTNRPSKQKTNLPVYDNMSDTLIKDYAKRRKAGEILPTNPMTATSNTHMENTPPLYSIATALMVGPLKKSQYFPFGSYREFQLSSNVVRVPPVVQPKELLGERDVQRIQVDALSKLRRQGMDMLTTAAELRQTLAMLAGVRRKLIRLVVAAVRLLRNHRKYVWTWGELVTEFIQNPWLEGRFGWRILYYDLLAIQKFLDSKDEGTRFIVGRSSERADLTEVRDGVTYMYTDEIKVGYPGTLDLSLPGFASTTNTMWEILTFSLVVDMFFDVQKRILAYSGQAINVKEHHEASFVTRTQRVVAVAQAEMPAIPQWLGSNASQIPLYEPAIVSVYGSKKTRLPTTVPALGLPSFQLSLGGYKPVDLAFLTRIIISKMF